MVQGKKNKQTYPQTHKQGHSLAEFNIRVVRMERVLLSNPVALHPQPASHMGLVTPGRSTNTEYYSSLPKQSFYKLQTCTHTTAQNFS